MVNEEYNGQSYCPPPPVRGIPKIETLQVNFGAGASDEMPSLGSATVRRRYLLKQAGKSSSHPWARNGYMTVIGGITTNRTYP